MSESIRDRLSNHAPIIGEQTSNPNFVALSVKDLQELVELAHEAVHPQEQEESELSSVSLRLHALQLATHVDLARLQASSGGQWSSDPVGLAEAYYAFLTTKDEIDGP